MRELTSTATGTAEQPIEQCFVHLTNIEQYPSWYPDGAKRVEVLERDEAGRPLHVDATLAAVAGPLRKNFDMRLQVETQEPRQVSFSRVADDRGEHEGLTITWQLQSLEDSRTEVTLRMIAHIDLPPFLPVGQIAQEAANGFLQAALASLQ